MNIDPDWQADLSRYPPRPFLKEQSIWAVWLYRLGRRTDRLKDRRIKWLSNKVYWLLFRVIETLTGISLPKRAKIGPGLRIWHFGGVIVHPDAELGARCTLRQGVTIGNRHEGGPVPIVGNDVEFGAYAQVLGGVRIGDHCKIGAMSVVLTDVPDWGTAVGVPARIVLPDAAGAHGRPRREFQSNS